MSNQFFYLRSKTQDFLLEKVLQAYKSGYALQAKKKEAAKLVAKGSDGQLYKTNADRLLLAHRDSNFKIKHSFNPKNGEAKPERAPHMEYEIISSNFDYQGSLLNLKPDSLRKAFIKRYKFMEEQYKNQGTNLKRLDYDNISIVNFFYIE